jgi:hypothetical protein
MRHRFTNRVFLVAPGLLLLALLAHRAVAQETVERLASQSLRPYWHVFIAYALAWALVFGWVVSIARRLARAERESKG